MLRYLRGGGKHTKTIWWTLIIVTVVTFLGNVEGDNTFVPPGRPNGWLLRYLNTRFFRLSNNRIKVLVRVPSGEEEE